MKSEGQPGDWLSSRLHAREITVTISGSLIREKCRARINNLLLCETIKSRVSLIRQILQKDYKDAWWVHNLSQSLVVTREYAVSERLAVTKAECLLRVSLREYQKEFVLSCRGLSRASGS